MTWNLLGNPVVLAGIDAGTGDAPTYYLDTWDGFPDARIRLIEQLAGADNPVVLTGDYHAGHGARRPRAPLRGHAGRVHGADGAADLVAAVPGRRSARTPQLRQQLNAHGYLAVTVEPERLTARFQVLDDVTDPDSGDPHRGHLGDHPRRPPGRPTLTPFPGLGDLLGQAPSPRERLRQLRAPVVEEVGEGLVEGDLGLPAGGRR